jgi:hypothetical protein
MAHICMSTTHLSIPSLVMSMLTLLHFARRHLPRSISLACTHQPSLPLHYHRSPPLIITSRTMSAEAIAQPPAPVAGGSQDKPLINPLQTEGPPPSSTVVEPSHSRIPTPPAPALAPEQPNGSTSYLPTLYPPKAASPLPGAHPTPAGTTFDPISSSSAPAAGGDSMDVDRSLSPGSAGTKRPGDSLVSEDAKRVKEGSAHRSHSGTSPPLHPPRRLLPLPLPLPPRHPPQRLPPRLREKVRRHRSTPTPRQLSTPGLTLSPQSTSKARDQLRPGRRSSTSIF